MKNVETCENCGWVGTVENPTQDLTIFKLYDGEMLCASCRLDARIADDDFSSGGKQ